VVGSGSVVGLVVKEDDDGEEEEKASEFSESQESENDEEQEETETGVEDSKMRIQLLVSVVVSYE